MSYYKELPCRRCGHVWKWSLDKKDTPYCPEGYGCRKVEGKKQMKILDLLGDVLESPAMDDLLDHVVLGKLRSSLDSCIIERERLDNIKKNRELFDHEVADWECLVQDIHALNRVIDYYGG